MSELFGVMVVNKKQQVMILGSTLELDLQWADGMVGCMPVFGSREAAEKYAGSRRIDIVSLSIGDE